MNKNAIALFLVAIGGLIVALFLGSFVAQGDFFKLGILAGVVAITALCVGLRENIWMIIPLCSALSGSILILPLPFAVSELAILLAFATFLILFAMKAIPRFSAFNRCDGLMILNLVYLLTVYIRNPAGLLRFQTDIVGARPYASVLIAVLGFWVLQHVTLSSKNRYLVPLLASAGGIGGAFISIVTAFLPNLAVRLQPFYSGVTLPNDPALTDPGAQGTGRSAYLSGYASSVGQILVAFRDPARLLIFVNPFLSLLFFSAIAAYLLTGFRSNLIAFAALSAMSTYFRSGLPGLIRVGLAGILCIMLLIGVQESGNHLPLSVQRTLSFLPGSWDPTAVKDAQGSSDWRFIMWREALTSERYIRNKIFGDGFGYRMSDLSGFMNMGGMVGAGTDQIQEYFLVIGAYHSGPVSTIRMVGVFGLVLFNIWIFAQAGYAWKLIRDSRRSPFFVWALFVGSPAVLMPLFYWFIFGAFENDLPAVILSLAALNILARSLNRWKKEKTSLTETDLVIPLPPPNDQKRIS